MSIRLRALTVAVASSLVVVTLAGTAPSARAEPTSQSRPRILSAGSSTVSPQSSGSQGLAPQTVTTQAAVDPALSSLNELRSRVGSSSLAVTSATQSAVSAHAVYLELNKDDANLNPNDEQLGKPGYSAEGDAIAPFTVTVAEANTHAIALDVAMTDPWARSTLLLNPRATSAAFAHTATFTVIGLPVATSAVSTSWPKVFPAKASHRGLAWTSSGASYYTSQCSQNPVQWGYPISVQLDDTRIHQVLGAQATLTEDGQPVETCVVSDAGFTGVDGLVLVVPTRPLVPGAIYSGRVRGTAVTDQGASQNLDAAISFTTAATARGNGDQTGDGVADLLAVDTAGTLQMIKGQAGAGFGARWPIGRGWGTTIWVGHVPDLDGNRTDELLAVRSDGSMWLYLGSGMGGYASGRQVGRGWNTVRNITVIGDMTHDSTPEVVAISSSGDLVRYTLTRSGFTSTNKIGRNWQAISFTVGLGDFNRDGWNDLVAVSRQGDLIAYYVRNGIIVQAAKVGRGWSGWTAVFTPGDLSGDGVPDLVGRNSSGTLYAYQTGWVSFSPARLVGTGFGGYRLFA
ncbi:FG-GAP repeat domain-containing protein [Aestuariimicrobium sp. T2.26MG-19.2B]|uniref:FG-GAP repeat domain-containing protein n=1 Tax=Aestuariimicrobium sp. T2.26MG-19.2B TaxID=3040679 RepID=UPI0024773D94|nr:VCBS repeat-containing protein [Aestuariimicrobium sp. T2.26MG-19.2B]CAI9399168.1 hypothetical protein AESSP_00138 [Aestuariimicrobium sp. T2.26MG-19.2B]